MVKTNNVRNMINLIIRSWIRSDEINFTIINVEPHFLLKFDLKIHIFFISNWPIAKDNEIINKAKIGNKETTFDFTIHMLIGREQEFKIPSDVLCGNNK